MTEHFTGHWYICRNLNIQLDKCEYSGLIAGENDDPPQYNPFNLIYKQNV